MRRRHPVFRGRTRRNEGEWGNLFALGAQQERAVAIQLCQQQAERQQRTSKALRCGGVEMLKMRMHPLTIAQPPQQFKDTRTSRV